MSHSVRCLAKQGAFLFTEVSSHREVEPEPMILTCPACGTQYVVKDGAIPPAGRQVRCAACKHSWHQNPEEGEGDRNDVMTSSAPAQVETGPPADEPDAPPFEEAVEASASTGYEPFDEDVEAEAMSQPDANYGLTAPAYQACDEVMPEAVPEAALEPAASWTAPEEAALDEDFAIPTMEEREAPKSRGRILLLLLLLIAALAAAFWFLAPPDLKARVGLAESGATPLEVMLTTSDRQKLASGNELLAISGRIINPTDREVAVPPIRASLRNKTTRQLVYEWTIAPPARSLPPRGSASFNSAEVDIPQGGDELTVSLGDPAA